MPLSQLRKKRQKAIKYGKEYNSKNTKIKKFC